MLKLLTRRPLANQLRRGIFIGTFEYQYGHGWWLGSDVSKLPFAIAKEGIKLIGE